MHRAWIALWGLVCVPSALFAADLTKVDRTIGKLPELRSKSPEYCLLVLGPEAKTRVWLVHDGDVVYVDRNGNGDLTEGDERIAADPKWSKPEENVFSFQAGDISDGQLVHKDLRVSWSKMDHMRDRDAQVHKHLEQKPQARGCSIRVDVAMPGLKGTGIEGRVEQAVVMSDEHGFIEFSAKPEEAPIVRFGGPWEVTFGGREEWEVGRSREVYLVVGTPGLGPGTTSYVQYEGIIPRGLTPTLEVTYPAAADDQKPKTTSYELTRRCCTYNLYGDVAVPEGVGIGKARVSVTLESWPGAFVAPTTHDVAILSAKPGPKLEPVSTRLKSKLEHVHPDGGIVAIQFSPDGSRLVAGDYPGGIIHTWDLATGKRLVTIDAGEGYRGSMEYFAVSPDCKTLYAPRDGKNRFEKIAKDGKKLFRVDYDDAVYMFDLNSGELVRKWKDDPPRGIRGLELTPDGRYFVTLDEVPGEYESLRPHALSLWDALTGSHRQVAGDGAHCYAFSPDSKLAAVSIGGSGDEHEKGDMSVRLFSLPEWTERCKISLEGKHVRAYVPAFACQGRVVVGRITTYAKANDWGNPEDTLRFWDAASGEQLFSISPAEKNEQFVWVKASPDSQTVVACNWWRQAGEARIYIVEVARRRSRIVRLAPDASAQAFAFHPSGRWLAVTTQVIPQEQRRTTS